jgi:hypothetical protein
VEIERAMQVLQRFTQEPEKGKKRSKAKNAPKFDVRERLFKMCGVDLMRIPLIVDTRSRLIADSVPGDRGHPLQVS